MRWAASSPDRRFQAGHHFEGVEHVGFAQRHGDRAAVGQQLDQAFGRQHLDRFAQRRARDLQHFGQLALVELGAGRDAVFHQHLAQALRHLLVQRGAGDGNDVGGHLAILYAK